MSKRVALVVCLAALALSGCRDTRVVVVERNATTTTLALPAMTCPEGFVGVHIEALRRGETDGFYDIAGTLYNHYPVPIAPITLQLVGTGANGSTAMTVGSVAESALAAGGSVAPGAAFRFAMKLVFFRYTAGQFNDEVTQETVSVGPGSFGEIGVLAPGCDRSRPLARLVAEQPA